MSEKSYTFFDGNKKYNINLIGIRRDNAGTNKFDDFMAVLYKGNNLKEVCKLYPITTDPGEHWLRTLSILRGLPCSSQGNTEAPGN